MTKIIDLETLSAFIQEIVDAVPGIEKLIVISNGEDGIEELDTYFQQDYAGTTAILQIPQVDRQGDNQLGLLCSLTIVQKPDSQTLADKLKARSETIKLALATIGKLELAGDESIETIETYGEAYTVELNVHHNSLFSVGRIANVFTVGWYFDIDIVIPANPLLYPDA